MDRTINILLVEDNPDHAEQLSEAFDEGFNVDVVSDKESCFRMLERKTYQFIVLDYCLGRKENGLDILQALNVTGNDVPKIVVTAYGNEQIAVEALKLGARDYVPKTLNSEHLQRVVELVRQNLKRYYHVNDQLATQTTLRVLREQKEVLIRAWVNRIRFLADKHELLDGETLPEDVIDGLYEAFLTDIDAGNDEKSSLLLRGFIANHTPGDWCFPLIELILIGFKDAARTVVSTAFPESFDRRVQFMTKVGQLIEGSELELSKRYCQAIREAQELHERSVRLRLKSHLTITLQHEIRQPLTYILNCAEDLAECAENEDVRAKYLEIKTQAKRIDTILSRLERASEIPTTKYGEGVDMLDMSAEEDVQ